MEDPLVWWTGQSDVSITQGLPHPFIGTLTLLVSHVAHAEVFASEVRKLLVSKSLEYDYYIHLLAFNTVFCHVFKVVLMRMDSMDSTDSIGATKATSYPVVIMLVKKIQ